jgi:hypothetical protein
MTLLISNKDQLAAVSPLLPTSFLQIEQWANNSQWNPIGYGTNQTTPTTVQNGQASFSIDPLGYVHLRGYLTTNGTTPVDLATIPLSASPTSQMYFPCAANYANDFNAGGWVLGVSPGGILTTSDQSANPGDQYYFDGVVFPTF